MKRITVARHCNGCRVGVFAGLLTGIHQFQIAGALCNNPGGSFSVVSTPVHRVFTEKNMNSNLRKIVFGLTTTAIVWSPVALTDDEASEKAIKARQGLMQVYSFNLGMLSAMAKGEADYDAELAAVAATNLNVAASMNTGAMWPQGSSNEDHKTRALPEIWSTYPKVAESGKALADSSAALAAVAGDGLDALKGSIGDVGKSCKGCHDDFRAKKK